MTRLWRADVAGTIAMIVLAWAAPARGQNELVPYRVEGAAIPTPLAGGDAVRGKQLVLSRDTHCILCHAVPESGIPAMGDLGPPLAGVGARFGEGELRLRIVDSSRLNPDTIMPSYYRVEGLNQVAAQYRGKPVLTAQQVEDVIAYLKTLR